MVIVNTGDGKGKSSSAFGVMGRGWARGWNVGVIQFIKSGSWNTGERKLALAADLQGDLLLGFTWESSDMDETEARGRHAWEVAKVKLASGDYQLLILDEITYAVNFGWIPVEAVTEALSTRSPRTNVVITGRDAPAEIVEMADTVTEMRSVKHAYERGIRAIKGIEY